MSKRRTVCGVPAVAALTGLTPGRRVVPAHQVAALEQTVVDAAAAAERIRSAEQACAERLNQVLDRARVEGVTAAHLEANTKLLAFLEQISSRALDHEAELVALVIGAVEKILGRLPPDLMVVDLAARALAQARENFVRVTLLVNPQISPDLDVLRTRLTQAQVDIEQLCIEHDASLSLNACRLCTVAGEIDASLDVQLAALTAALLDRREAASQRDFSRDKPARVVAQ